MLSCGQKIRLGLFTLNKQIQGEANKSYIPKLIISKNPYILVRRNKFSIMNINFMRIFLLRIVLLTKYITNIPTELLFILILNKQYYRKFYVNIFADKNICLNFVYVIITLFSF